MKKLLLLFFCALISMQSQAQDTALQDKVTLNTGDVYTGEIIMRNNEMIMLKTASGTRFQFPLSEVQKVEKVSPADTVSDQQVQEAGLPTDNFGGIIEVSGGVSNAVRCFEFSPNAQVLLIFGSKSVWRQPVFLGFGAGYNNTWLSSISGTVGFLPVFLRLQKTLSQTVTSSYVGLDAGYAFALTSGYGGGTFVKASVGIIRQINHKTAVTFGVYGGINSIAGTITETNELGTFAYYGNTTMNSMGVKVGLQF